MRYLLVLFILIGFGCQQSRSDVNTKLAIEATPSPNDDSVAAIDLPSLEIGQDLFSIGGLSPYLFGKFFNGRVAFYIIEDTPITIGDKVYSSTAVLYFIDEILYKKQFLIQETIVKDFFDSFAQQGFVANKPSDKLDENRFFTVKVNAGSSEIKLKKTDFGHYSIEEYHHYFNRHWNAVVSQSS